MTHSVQLMCPLWLASWNGLLRFLHLHGAWQEENVLTGSSVCRGGRTPGWCWGLATPTHCAANFQCFHLLIVIFFILGAFLFNGAENRMPVFSISYFNMKLNIERRGHLEGRGRHLTFWTMTILSTHDRPLVSQFVFLSVCWLWPLFWLMKYL